MTKTITHLAFALLTLATYLVQADEPAPTPSPAPAAEAANPQPGGPGATAVPTVKIVIAGDENRATKPEFEVGDGIRVELKTTGDVRGDFDIEFSPKIKDSNVYADRKEPANKRVFWFTAPEGVYQIRVLAIGVRPGEFGRDTTPPIKIVSPNPAPAEVSEAKPAQRTIEDEIRVRAKRVRTTTPLEDNLAIAKAATKTAREIKGGLDPKEAVRQWKINAIVELMGAERLTPWDRAVSGESFFDFAAKVLDDAKPDEVAGALAGFAAVLEGK